MLPFKPVELQCPVTCHEFVAKFVPLLNPFPIKSGKSSVYLAYPALFINRHNRRLKVSFGLTVVCSTMSYLRIKNV